MGVVNEAPTAFRSSTDRPRAISLIRSAITDVWSRRRLIGYMVRADVKKRGVDTVLGNVWWVLDPLITMLVYVLVMTVIFQRSTPDFPLFLLSAMVPFKWFTATIGNSTGAVVGKEGLIKQILFPKIILPVTGSISQIVSFLFGLLVLVVLWFFLYNDHVSIYVVWVPVIAAVQYVFVLGIALLVSSITVFYRDVGIVIGHFMRLLFWISPILWSFAAVAGRGAALSDAMAGVDRTLGLPVGSMFTVLKYNPISLLLEDYRQVIYGHLEGVNGKLEWTAPTAPNVEVLAAIFVTGMVILIVGTIVFKRLEPNFAKIL